MNIFRSIEDIQNSTCGAVVAIGNFDGVHKGHQALINRASEIARGANKKLAVLTFEPHPRALFRPDEPPARLTPPDLKADRLRECGVDILYSLNFDWEFASLSAQDFIEKILKDSLNAAHVVVGYDFRFGQLRKGAPTDISNAGIPVSVIDAVKGADGTDYSSSRIRECLRTGDIRGANEILGWDWEIRGEVMRGDGRGKGLGYPTANMKMGDFVHPAYGVYAARVCVDGEDQWHGAAINIGIRPMFEIPEAEVESFIFDFNRDLYGKILHVRPIERLRGEAKFASVEELKAQMAKDCENAIKILK